MKKIVKFFKGLFSKKTEPKTESYKKLDFNPANKDLVISNVYDLEHGIEENCFFVHCQDSVTIHKAMINHQSKILGISSNKTDVSICIFDIVNIDGINYLVKSIDQLPNGKFLLHVECEKPIVASETSYVGNKISENAFTGKIEGELYKLSDDFDMNESQFKALKHVSQISFELGSLMNLYKNKDKYDLLEEVFEMDSDGNFVAFQTKL